MKAEGVSLVSLTLHRSSHFFHSRSQRILSLEKRKQLTSPGPRVKPECALCMNHVLFHRRRGLTRAAPTQREGGQAGGGCWGLHVQRGVCPRPLGLCRRLCRCSSMRGLS